ncbi:unnamed protein product [Prorocentrum cordatum]|uniref:Transmembrane protein n=1 Tax=Prorocentrum cordatum TaxID=2364126 RepID=A0ABN9XI32_9DINO|nr:unnamed protein product [Polarella glacialis]
MMDRERLNFAKQGAGRLAPVLALWVLLNGLRIVSSGGDRFHHDAIPLAFLLVVCVFVELFPDGVTTKSLNSFFAMLCFWPVCTALAGQDIAQRSDSMVAVLVDTFKRFFLQALVGANTIHPKVACTLILLQGIARAIIFWLRGDAQWFPSDAEGVLLALGMCLWIVLVELRFLGVFRCSLETFDPPVIELRLHCLLYALYDVVVTLDTDLCVAARAPKLDLLLNTRDAQGAHLADFMGSTDRQRFLEFVARAPPDVSNAKSNPPPAQSLNVHLLDGRGSWIQVQLFHTQFQNFGSKQVEHLIGICEVGDSGGRAAGGGTGCGTSGISVGRESSRAGTGTSVDAPSTTHGPDDQDSDCSLVAGDSASAAGIRSRTTRDPRAEKESSIAELPEQEDRVGPLRGEAEDSYDGASWQQSTQQPGEVNITFDTLRFTIRQSQSTNPVVDASLLTNESLQQWVAGWLSCRAWMEDFVNAILRPVNSESWPDRAGPPASASFRVAFRGSCKLPPDILTRNGVPYSPPSFAVPGVGAANGIESRRPHSSDVDGAMTFAGSGPPVRMKVSKVSISRRRRDDRSSRHHSRERVSPSTPVRGHSSPALATQRGRFPQESAHSRRTDAEPGLHAPAPSSFGAAQSRRESVDSLGESESKDGAEMESEHTVQI